MFDVFEIGDYVNELLGLEPSDPVNEKFETMGLEDLYFINNVGSFSIIFAYFCFLVALYLLLYPFEKIFGKVFKRARRHLDKSLFWNAIAGLLFESILNILLCGLITIKYNYDEGFQANLALTIMSVYLTIPFMILIYLIYNFDKLEHKIF